jgi:hypothetical protein
MLGGGGVWSVHGWGCIGVGEGYVGVSEAYVHVKNIRKNCGIAALKKCGAARADYYKNCGSEKNFGLSIFE